MICLMVTKLADARVCLIWGVFISVMGNCTFVTVADEHAEQNYGLISQLRSLLENIQHIRTTLLQQRTRLHELYNMSASTESTATSQKPKGFFPTFFADCKEIFNAGYTDSGVYDIWLFHGYKFLSVYCDMEVPGEFSGEKGWVTIQRRMDGTLNFNRGWDDYVNGFGFPDGEHWLGLENIYQLLHQRLVGVYDTGSLALRIDFEDWDGTTAYVEYNQFDISSKAFDYELNSLGKHIGQEDLNDPIAFTIFTKFSTSDHNTDKQRPAKCVNEQTGGWWFGQCWHWNLNGRYAEKGGKMTRDKMYIRRWDRVNPSNMALRYVSMKLQ